MNKEQVEMHGDVIKWFCENPDKGVWERRAKKLHKLFMFWTLTKEPNWYTDKIYVQNDECAELRKKYYSGDYFCIIKKGTEYFEISLPNFIYEDYELILILNEHKHIYNSYKEDNSVDIVEVRMVGCSEVEYKVDNFIEDYDECKIYKLKPKMKTITIIKFLTKNGKIIEMDKSKVHHNPVNILDEYKMVVYDD